VADLAEWAQQLIFRGDQWHCCSGWRESLGDNFLPNQPLKSMYPMSTTLSDTLVPELGTKKVPVNYQCSAVLIEILQPGSMSVERFTASELVLSATPLL
jgi:hypothetical protein